MTSPHPIACKLTDRALRERLDALRTGLFARTQSVQQGDNSITFMFAGTDELVKNLTQFVVLERQCCPFLHFTLDIPPEPGDVKLVLSGNDTTRTFIQDTFVSLVSKESTSP